MIMKKQITIKINISAVCHKKYHLEYRNAHCPGARKQLFLNMQCGEEVKDDDPASNHSHQGSKENEMTPLKIFKIIM